MALIDEAIIKIQSGAGGNGCVSFRREKYVPRGGPNGGNGGRGASVYLVGTRDKTSLLDFKFQPKFMGERGEHGMGSDCDGRGAEDLYIQVPLGTLVIDTQTGLLLGDITEHEQQMLIAKGGRGGRGNMTFATSTNRAPRTATKGEPGEIKELKLELQVLADIGLIGLPNAGKSSFLRSISRATPKIADYPFTTLEPHLGVVFHKQQSIVVADLPGLIEGASEGAGLGHRFLRHVSRNRILLHLVEVTPTTAEIKKRVKLIRKELETYDSDLLDRAQWLVFTKCDLLSEEDLKKKKAALRKAKLDGFFISSSTHFGVDDLLTELAVTIEKLNRKSSPPPPPTETVVEEVRV